MNKPEAFSTHCHVKNIHREATIPLTSTARVLALDLLNGDFDKRDGKAVEEDNEDAFVYLEVDDLSEVQSHPDFRNWVVLRATYSDKETARFHLLPDRTSAEFYTHFKILRKENGAELVSTEASAPSL